VALHSGTDETVEQVYSQEDVLRYITFARQFKPVISEVRSCVRKVADIRTTLLVAAKLNPTFVAKSDAVNFLVAARADKNLAALDLALAVRSEALGTISRNLNLSYDETYPNQTNKGSTLTCRLNLS